MLDELIKLADHLDKIGRSKEADYLDKIIKKAAVLPENIKNKYKNYVSPEEKYESIIGENFSAKMESNSFKSLEELDQDFVDTLIGYAEAEDDVASRYLRDNLIISEEPETNPFYNDDLKEDVLRRHHLDESDVIKIKGDPYEYIYDIYSDNFVVVNSPRAEEIGARIGKEDNSYYILARNMDDQILENIFCKANTEFKMSDKFTDRLNTPFDIKGVDIKDYYC